VGFRNSEGGLTFSVIYGGRARRPAQVMHFYQGQDSLLEAQQVSSEQSAQDYIANKLEH